MLFIIFNLCVLGLILYHVVSWWRISNSGSEQVITCSECCIDSVNVLIL